MERIGAESIVRCRRAHAAPIPRISTKLATIPTPSRQRIFRSGGATAVIPSGAARSGAASLLLSIVLPVSGLVSSAATGSVEFAGPDGACVGAADDELTGPMNR